MSKPRAIAPDYDSLPKEWTALPIWLGWAYQLTRDSKGNARWTKVPHGTSTDSTTWKPLKELNGRYRDGVAIALGDRRCGIDIDCAFDADGELKPFARALVEKFDSYTEVSPGGGGLHINFYSSEDLNLRGVKRGGKDISWEVAFYTQGRCWCMTGKIFEGRSEIKTADADRLCEFYEELRSGKFDVTPSKPNAKAGDRADGNAQNHTASQPANDSPRDKWDRLKRGEWQGLYASQSEADMAYVGYLARQGGPDPVQIDQEFRKSGLCRSKWNEPRPGGTYGSLTIAAVLGNEPKVAVIRELTRPDMPESVLDGRLGEIYQRRMKDFALAYAWGPMLVIAGTSPALKRNGPIRGNLYYSSIGDVGTGKSSAEDHALHVLGVHALGPALLKAKYGSAEGLADDLKDAGSCVRLLAPDELSHLLRKCAIEHSSFPAVLTTAFYQDRQRGGTKKDRWEIDVRLSIMGGIVEVDFEDVFGFASVSGLYDRFLFGLMPRPCNYEYSPPSGCAESISPVPPKVDGDIWEVSKQWRKDGISGRVAEISLRAAWICAAFDGRPTLRGCELGPACALAKYQMKVREFLKPNPGKNPDAQCAVSIVKWLAEHAPPGEWMLRRDVSRGIHSDRLGPGVFHRALQNLQFNDEVELDLKRKLVRLVPEAGTGW